MAGGWEELCGWSQGWLESVPLRDLIHPAEADSLFTALLRADGGSHEFLARFRHADGGFRWLAWNGRPSRDGARVVAGARDVSDRVQTEAARSRQLSEAQHGATHDPLTGLANRALLVEHLSLTLSRALRTGVPPVLLFVDLDGFKRVNDQLGHQQGDEALRALSSRLESAFRPSDLIARVGGDEFVVVLEGGDPSAAAERAERALVRPLRLAGHEYQIGATVGAIAIENPDTPPAQAIAAADAEMYRHKQLRQAGRTAGTGESGAVGSSRAAAALAGRRTGSGPGTPPTGLEPPRP